MSTFNEAKHPRNHPTGKSRFSDKPNSEPEVTIGAPVTPPGLLHFQEISASAFRANDALLGAGVDAIREQLKLGAPNAVSAKFQYAYDNDGSSNLSFDEARDADGEIAELPFDNVSEINYIGTSFSDEDDVTSRSEFENDGYSEDYHYHYYTMDLTSAPPEPTVSVALRNMKAIIESRAQLGKQLSEAGKAGIAAVARRDYPGAAAVLLVDINDGDGSPYFMACSVEGANENLLADEVHGKYDIADRFEDFAPLMDRDMSLLEATTVGGAPVYRLRF